MDEAVDGMEPPAMATSELRQSHPNDLPPILIHPDAAAIAKGWKEKALATQALYPGLAAAPMELFNETEGVRIADAMCSGESVGWLSKSFGPPAARVDGKSGKAACRVYAFMGATILSFSEPGNYGTGWQLLLGPQEDHGGGRSYGRAGLLSWNPTISGFWRLFCASMAAQMEMDPLEARAMREAREIAGQAEQAPSAAKPRL